MAKCFLMTKDVVMWPITSQIKINTFVTIENIGQVCLLCHTKPTSSRKLSNYKLKKQILNINEYWKCLTEFFWLTAFIWSTDDQIKI